MKWFLAALVLVAGSAHAQEVRVISSGSLAHTVTQANYTISGDQTRLVRLVCTQACFIAVAKTPLVTSSTGTYLPANDPVLLKVSPGLKIGVSPSATLGTLYVSEVEK